MSIRQLRTEIKELKDSIISQYEPACKVFIMGTKDSPPEEEITAYRRDHSHTRVVVLFRRGCGQGSTD